MTNTKETKSSTCWGDGEWWDMPQPEHVLIWYIGLVLRDLTYVERPDGTISAPPRKTETVLSAMPFDELMVLAGAPEDAVGNLDGNEKLGVERDLAWIWKLIQDKTRRSMPLASPERVLISSDEDVLACVSEIEKRFCVSELLDAVRRGVPVEDVMA